MLSCVGAMFAPDHAAGPPPTAWGDPQHVTGLFATAARVRCTRRTVRLRFGGTADELADHYLEHFAPVMATAAGLDEPGRAALRRDLVQLIGSPGYAVAGEDGRYELEYLQVLVTPAS